ncbi:response regulator transcription factor [Bradyrhizobium liaoningense]|uniref:response regulator transcription factor n=1 Tax=Bradyrhizobium liaoningense TaxID=43992 RepID=UPI002011F0B6|nr:LuxR C-terminal-related transcriptional regulator [Bradyrhizobium liaoningense]
MTPRERQVFELVARGKLNKQIGYVLGCTERTIKAHRSRVMEKTQVQSLAELVALAERMGIHRTGLTALSPALRRPDPSSFPKTKVAGRISRDATSHESECEPHPERGSSSRLTLLHCTPPGCEEPH